MEKLKKDEISNVKINQSRNNLIELFREYQSIDKFLNVYNRVKKNSNQKSMKSVLGIFFLSIFIYSIGLIFLKKCSVVVIIVWIITLAVAIYVIKKEWTNLEKYRNEMVSIRDDDICTLLVEKGINSKNIKDAIDYFVLELEPVDIVYKESPKLNSVSKFGSNLFFLILGIIIPSVIKEKVNQNGVQAYAIIIAALIIIGFIICMIKAYAYIDRKDTYLDKTRKLVIELKQIDLLNKLN